MIPSARELKVRGKAMVSIKLQVSEMTARGKEQCGWKGPKNGLRGPRIPHLGSDDTVMPILDTV